jgi:hypothetical protein
MVVRQASMSLAHHVRLKIRRAYPPPPQAALSASAQQMVRADWSGQQRAQAEEAVELGQQRVWTVWLNWQEASAISQVSLCQGPGV